MTASMERILRREMHSSRAPLAGLAATVVALLAIYILLEAVLRAVGQPPWLVDPLAAATNLASLPAGVSPLLLGLIGAVVMLVGLVFVLNAILPGRRARHAIANPRAAVVVDDEVVASALARRARLAAGVTREQVMVVVSRNLVQVNVRPTSGIPLDGDTVRTAVEDELDAMELLPRPVVRVALAPMGVVGV
ncbi:DUF6286 domain-containing protein [Arthrobacter sp. 35W]|uniref:DUF6286 domain-containing protein n=1 Tax=Arthrobacter sp. 35W TaxID=1132441 RepID=UPI003FA4C3A6